MLLTTVETKDVFKATFRPILNLTLTSFASPSRKPMSDERAVLSLKVVLGYGCCAFQDRGTCFP